MAKPDSGSWKQLAEQKEKEWREVLELRIEALENELGGKEKELFNEQAKFHELKEHFKYNLKLLEERDCELEKYDFLFQEHRSALNAKTAEISELKIHLDDLKSVIDREEKAKDELQSNYQRRLREKQAEVDAYKSSKDGEVQGERKEYEKFRRDLHRQLASVQGELDTQKRELTTEFETAMKKREHEFKLEKDELEAKVFEFDLKVKLLAKELELSRDCNEKTQSIADEKETSQRNLEKQLKQKDWELADMTAVKESMIAELKSQLTASEGTMKKMHEDFQRKYTELDRCVREREETLKREKAGFLEREQSLQSDNQTLQSKLEDMQVKERQSEWAHQDVVKEKDVVIEKLQEEVKDVKERWDRHVAEISRSNVERDTELDTAKEENERLRSDLRQRKLDLERYKKELKAAAEREEQLDRAKIQAELDFKRRTEDLECQQYNQAEDLIDKLTTARDQAQSLVRERERELRHKVLLVKSLHRERDQLRGVLKDHNIQLDNFVKYSIGSEKVEDEMNYVESLQKQNSDLKQLIAQMRSEMESLSPDNMETENKDRNQKIENKEEIEELKQENRELKQKLSSRPAQPGLQTKVYMIDPDKEKEVMEEVEGNSVVKNHLTALNATIGNLRSEKVELAATVKKQQVRIAFLENSLEEISKQPRQKQAQIDQLNYELTTSKQRAETEVAGLKRRISELELMLGEARREADEYHKDSVDRNMELVAMGNQLAALKMEQSGPGSSVNFGAQELYIQQLQSELSQLRKRASALDPSSDVSLGPVLAGFSSGSDSAVDGSGGVASLQYKLRSAASKIVQLAKENQQLTESNNRLRAELRVAIAGSKPNNDKVNHSKAQDNATSQPSHNISVDAPEDSESFQGRLSQLENLQYQLTRQELQFAQRFKEGTKSGNFETDNTNDSHRSAKESENLESTNKDQYSNNIQTSQQSAAVDQHKQPSPSASRQEHLQRGRRGIEPHMMMSMSSGGGESMQQVWQMLDESITSYGPSEFAAVSPRSAIAASRTAVGDGGDEPFVLKGQNKNQSAKSRTSNQGKPSSREAAISYARTRVPRPSQPSKNKIRNYNVRDDR